MWVESSETDFNDGVYNLTIASGTGTGAQLTLSPFGNAADGNVTISATKNINTDIITGGRSYADGINYAVTGVWISSITCSATPNGITANDEIILMNMQGCTTDYGNVGNYEFLRIKEVSGSQIVFNSDILKVYGSTHTGTNASLTNQKVIVQRVPNWGDFTITGATLTCSVWDGTKGGMVVFRATGTVTINSNAGIDVSTTGFRGGVSGGNGPEDARNPNITTGGADGGTNRNGGSSSRSGGTGGTGGDGGTGGTGGGGGGGGDGNGDNTGVGVGGAAPYDSGSNYSSAVKITLGGGSAAGGGGAGGQPGGGTTPATPGKRTGAGGAGGIGTNGNGGAGGNGGKGTGGGGIVYIMANNITGSGNISSVGGSGGSGGGGGGGTDGQTAWITGGGGGGGSAQGASGGTIVIGYGSSNWTGSASVNGGNAGGGGGGGGGCHINSTAGGGGGGGAGIGGGGGGGASAGNVVGGVGGNGGNGSSNSTASAGGDGVNGANPGEGGLAGGGGGGGYTGTGASAANTGGSGTPVGSNASGNNGGNGGSTTNGDGGGGGAVGTTGASGYSNIISTGIPFSFPGTYKSNVLDSGAKVVVSSIGWTPSSQPAGSNVNVGLRVSSASFSAGDAAPSWQSVTNGQTVNLAGRYVQYMSTFTTTSSTTTPRIEDITIAYKVKPWQEKTVVRTGKNSYGFGGAESWEWEVPAKSGQLVTITAYVRYNASYGAASKPKLTLYNLGISNTATMTQGADTWEQLTVSGTPNRNGVLKLKIEGFSAVPGVKMYVDDIQISQ